MSSMVAKPVTQAADRRQNDILVQTETFLDISSPPIFIYFHTFLQTLCRDNSKDVAKKDNQSSLLS
jgi:hypothetical protein